MRSVIGAILAFSVASNITLWFLVWNLKTELFDAEERFIDLLTKFAKQPTEDGSSECAE